MNLALLGFPPEASSYAGRVDTIFLSLLALCVVVAFGVFGLIFIFCIRYREGSSAPRPKEKINSTPIEITWMVIPMILFLIIFVFAGREYASIYSPPTSGTEIDIVGKQWMWNIQHADGTSEKNDFMSR